jgi:hypothetical protein
MIIYEDDQMLYTMYNSKFKSPPPIVKKRILLFQAKINKRKIIIDNILLQGIEVYISRV